MDNLHGAFNSDAATANNAEEMFKMPTFSGKPNTISVSEFLERFDHYVRIKALSLDELAIRLRSFVTDTAWKCLGQIVSEGLSNQELYAKYRETLVRTYGLSSQKAFAALVRREFDSAAETVDQYGSDVSYLSRTAFPDDPVIADKVAVRFFWYGLKNTIATKQLFSQWETGNRDLQNAISLCRTALDDLEQADEFYGFHEKGQKDFKYKKKSFYDEKHFEKVKKPCKICNRFNHETKNCYYKSKKTQGHQSRY